MYAADLVLGDSYLIVEALQHATMEESKVIYSRNDPSLDEYIFIDKDGDEIYVTGHMLKEVIEFPKVGDVYQHRGIGKSIVISNIKGEYVYWVRPGGTTIRTLRIQVLCENVKRDLVFKVKDTSQEEEEVKVEETCWYVISMLEGKPVGNWSKTSREKMIEKLKANKFNEMFSHPKEFGEYLDHLESKGGKIQLTYSAYSYGTLTQVKELVLC